MQLIKNKVRLVDQSPINPREADMEFFRSYPKEDRSTYIKAMLETPQNHQLKAEQVLIKKKYPFRSDFIFQGKRLNYNFLQTSQNPLAVLFYFHGMYCHSNDSGLLAHTVAERCQGVNIYGLDFLNAGSSDREEDGYYVSFDFLMKQAEQFIWFILGKFNRLYRPAVFLSGSSMGGSISFELGIRLPKLIKGVLLFGPALRQIQGDQVIAKKLGLCLGNIIPKARIVPQRFDIRARLDIQPMLQADQEMYNGNHVFGTTGLVLEEMEWIHQNFDRFETPYILFQGGVDKLVDPFAAVDLQKQSKSTDKTTIYFKHMWHQIPNQPQFKEICEISAKWLRQRVC